MSPLELYTNVKWSCTWRAELFTAKDKRQNVTNNIQPRLSDEDTDNDFRWVSSQICPVKQKIYTVIPWAVFENTHILINFV